MVQNDYSFAAEATGVQQILENLEAQQRDIADLKKFSDLDWANIEQLLEDSDTAITQDLVGTLRNLSELVERNRRYISTLARLTAATMRVNAILYESLPQEPKTKANELFNARIKAQNESALHALIIGTGDVCAWPDTGHVLGKLDADGIRELQKWGEPQQATEALSGWRVPVGWNYEVLPVTGNLRGLQLEQRGQEWYIVLSPNPPMDRDGRREDSERG